jgi:orotate phosphoribosyltransferase
MRYIFCEQCITFFFYFFQEKKDHGEGGVLVGASVEGKRVLIVDDVITAGTAIREAIKLLEAAGAIVAGVVIALDRAEIVSETVQKSAIQSVQEEYSIPVVNIIALKHLLSYVGSSKDLAEYVQTVETYRNQYGVKDK